MNIKCLHTPYFFQYMIKIMEDEHTDIIEDYENRVWHRDDVKIILRSKGQGVSHGAA